MIPRIEGNMPLPNGKKEVGLQKTALRNFYERPLGKIAKHIPGSPNIITVLSLVGAAGNYLIEQESDDPEKEKLLHKTGTALILLGYVFDVLDGTEARAKNMVTDFGAILDHGIDRVVDKSAGLSGLKRANWHEKIARKIYLALHSSPSTLRSIGIEDGLSIGELSPGSRLGRSAVLFARGHAPKKLKEPAFWLTDLAILYTTWRRYSIIQNGGSKEAKEKAKRSMLAQIGTFLLADATEAKGRHFIWGLADTLYSVYQKSEEIKKKNNRIKQSNIAKDSKEQEIFVNPN